MRLGTSKTTSHSELRSFRRFLEPPPNEENDTKSAAGITLSASTVFVQGYAEDDSIIPRDIHSSQRPIEPSLQPTLLAQEIKR